MEELDKALAREQLKANSQRAFRAVEVRDLNDIRRLVRELDPSLNQTFAEIPINSHLKSIEDNKQITYRVATKTRSKSKRDMLLEGLTIIKNRMEKTQATAFADKNIEVNGISMRPANFGNGIDGLAWIDSIIKQWLGGYRVGVEICWDLDGCIYKYNIFTHKLIGKRDETNSSN